MNLRQIQDIAGHRNVPPWVIKLVQDCIEHDRTWERSGQSSRAAMQMALKAFENLDKRELLDGGLIWVENELNALEEALAQPQGAWNEH